MQNHILAAVSLGCGRAASPDGKGRFIGAHGHSLPAREKTTKRVSTWSNAVCSKKRRRVEGPQQAEDPDGPERFACHGYADGPCHGRRPARRGCPRSGRRSGQIRPENTFHLTRPNSPINRWIEANKAFPLRHFREDYSSTPGNRGPGRSPGRPRPLSYFSRPFDCNDLHLPSSRS